jgi:hypothetical protein
MIHSTLREMTATERKALEAMKKSVGRLLELKTAGQWTGAFFIFVLFALIGFAAATLVALFFYLLGKLIVPLAILGSPVAVRIWQPLGAVVGMIGIPFCFKKMTFKARGEQMKKLASDLSKSIVEVLHVESDIAVKQESHEGDAAFFIQVEEGRALFLNGEYLQEAVAAENFPNTIFELVRVPKSKIILELKCLGNPYDVISTLSDFGAKHLPQDGEIVNKLL